ncbi:MAG: hypothetical protein A2161_16485 [Candidatus Schekmanbacteria bacterium RBG_13_48_7]|uniref:Type II secretion system protein J n=1 Tax=Candidatus Schekmanbacteria bacterium RBG_13_48_7 TaxID=1817878 RepID=A0A1F7RXT4_9BACT|nr:MAG: hypothetical protein A2161_16485 [Candidatus Schekmanbacteria bacterium RBG_13_48_7]
MLSRNRGFSLLELITVTAIISIFVVLIIEMDLAVRHRVNSNEAYLTLLAEGRDFMNMLEQDLKSGAKFSDESISLSYGQCYIDLEIPVPDRSTGVISGPESNRIVYYIPGDNPERLVRMVLNSGGSTEPYLQKVVLQHLKSIDILKTPVKEDPLFDFVIHLEKRIPDYPLVSVKLHNKVKVYI